MPTTLANTNPSKDANGPAPEKDQTLTRVVPKEDSPRSPSKLPQLQNFQQKTSDKVETTAAENPGSHPAPPNRAPLAIQELSPASPTKVARGLTAPNKRLVFRKSTGSSKNTSSNTLTEGLPAPTVEENRLMNDQDFEKLEKEFQATIEDIFDGLNTSESPKKELSTAEKRRAQLKHVGQVSPARTIIRPQDRIATPATTTISNDQSGTGSGPEN